MRLGPFASVSWNFPTRLPSGVFVLSCYFFQTCPNPARWCPTAKQQLFETIDTCRFAKGPGPRYCKDVGWVSALVSLDCTPFDFFPGILSTACVQGVLVGYRSYTPANEGTSWPTPNCHRFKGWPRVVCGRAGRTVSHRSATRGFSKRPVSINGGVHAAPVLERTRRKRPPDQICLKILCRYSDHSGTRVLQHHSHIRPKPKKKVSPFPSRPIGMAPCWRSRATPSCAEGDRNVCASLQSRSAADVTRIPCGSSSASVAFAASARLPPCVLQRRRAGHGGGGFFPCRGPECSRQRCCERVGHAQFASRWG